ncbi:MAG TPA: glycosyltransferase [Xanthobacteraceae bacterium]|nr:glycosyltransferase [Xanthobacteraceae bacterium]
MLLHALARQPILSAIGRRLLPSSLRQKIVRRAFEPPTQAHFKTLLSETMTMNCVPGRIVMVCGSLQPGGAERQVVNTLAGLAGSPAIESLTLLCDSLDGAPEGRHDFYLPLAQASGANVREIRKRSGKDGRSQVPGGFRKVMNKIHPGLAVDVADLYLEFRTLRPEVVHAWLDWSNVRAGLAAVLAGVPRVLLSGRNLSPRHFALNADYFHPSYRALAEIGPHQVLFLNNSDAGARDYAEWLSCPLERIQVIRNGLYFGNDCRPSEEHNAAFRMKFRIPANAPLIGGMFRFNEEKRPLLWLQVAARIAQEFSDAHFAIFGQGEMHGQMQELIRGLQLVDRIHLCGVVAPSLHGLSPCDLILLVSRGEGTPNVLLEAQWLGLPVVATDAGGAIEALCEGITGTVAISDDFHIVASAVTNILKDQAFIATARREGPRFVMTRYGMERMIQETLSAYSLGARIFQREQVSPMKEHQKDSCNAEVETGKRFRFGRNWQRFLRVLNDDRIHEAEKSLREFLQVGSLEGRTLIDIGSGSGLFSLAARRLGAAVLSFDYDPQSVACTEELRRRYFDGDPDWRIIAGSVLDREFLKSLGTFDIVYSWGVLHHTGQMWQALENVKLNTKPGGKLFIAIYNDCGEISERWKKKKIFYNGLPGEFKCAYALMVWTPIELKYFLYYCRNRKPLDYIRLWTEYKKSRGMSRWHDMIDWIGGYPYEYAGAKTLIDFYEKDGFALCKLAANSGYGCHQLVFDRLR